MTASGRDYERPDHKSKRKTSAPKAPARKKKKSINRNRDFAIVTYFTVFIFVCMMGYLAYFNAVKSSEIISNSHNPRLDAFEDRIIRGSIVSSDGKILAETVTEGDSSYRNYPYGNVFAHVVGYSSETAGKSGLELEANFALVTSNAFFPEKILNNIKDQKNQGDTVVTSLDTVLQETAYNALGNNRGAVVVMEPSTGRILALVSKPDFDPNTISETFDALNADTTGASPLYNRAIAGQYAPGSTFKILTALAYIRQNPNYNSYTYNCSGSITNSGVTVNCYNSTAHGAEDLILSFANSCNSSFINIGLSLDVNEYRSTCEDLLFNQKLPTPLSNVKAKSSFKLEEGSSAAEIMMTAMGQGETMVSPYHMALITCAIANDGVLMKPSLLDSVQNYSGSVIKNYHSQEYQRLMTKDEAAELTVLMKAVVDQGTGMALSGAGYTVAGKTGTAEYSTTNKNLSHSWFTGFSNVEDPDLVVSVIVEGNDGNISTNAVAIAKQIFDVYHSR